MAGKAATVKRDANRRLTKIYALKNSIEPSARALLCTDISTHLKQLTWGFEIGWCKESDDTADPRSPVNTPTMLPSSVRHPPGAFLFAGRAQLD
jgi:hypothetical protein